MHARPHELAVEFTDVEARIRGTSGHDDTAEHPGRAGDERRQPARRAGQRPVERLGTQDRRVCGLDEHVDLAAATEPDRERALVVDAEAAVLDPGSGQHALAELVDGSLDASARDAAGDPPVGIDDHRGAGVPRGGTGHRRDRREREPLAARESRADLRRQLEHGPPLSIRRSYVGRAGRRAARNEPETERCYVPGGGSMTGLDDRLDLVVDADAAFIAGAWRPATVGIRDGVIAAIEPLGAALATRTRLALDRGERLIPGLVDTHVHVNEPGRTEWEGFATATRAAAAGGVTTIVDMPLNSIPPTIDPAALAVKRASAASQAVVDVGFWGGAVPGNLGRLRALHDAGVFGFKCFLAPSGVDEFPHLDADGLTAALEELGAFDGLLIVHAEDPSVLNAHENDGGRSYARFVDSRPPEAELVAIRRVIDGIRATGGRAHILHLSSAAALPLIADAKAEGLRLTAETCPHYLTLDAEHIPDGATQFKCCPPIRDEAQSRSALAGPPRRGHRSRRLRPLAGDRRAEARVRRRLRTSMGRDLRTPARPGQRVDRGIPSRHRPRAGARLDVVGPRRLRPTRSKGPHRARRRRRPHRLRARHRLHGRAVGAGAQEPRLRVRGRRAPRRGHAHLAPRRDDRRRTQGQASRSDR